MADHSLPTTTSTYANFVSQMSARFNDLALGLDPANTTATNVPTNSVRWSSAANKFQKWNGTSWADLAATYAISVSGSAGTVPWSGVTSAPTTVSGFGIMDGVSTGGSYSNPAWITALAFSKLTGTPTTLSGYGITDGVNTSQLSTSGGASKVLQLDTNGNLGLGITPPTGWQASIKAMHIGTVASFAGETTGSAIMSDNCYFDGTNWKYMTANNAGQFYIGINGLLLFRAAASGAAGGNITWQNLLQMTTGGGAVFTRGAATTPVAVTFSATAMTVDCSAGNVFTTSFTANVTTAPTISNPIDGQTINWFITQDATGSRTMTWPTTFKWPGGTAGILSTTASAVDLLVATYRSATGFWYCSLSKAFA
jgi:hypothetical protein